MYLKQWLYLCTEHDLDRPEVVAQQKDIRQLIGIKVTKRSRNPLDIGSAKHGLGKVSCGELGSTGQKAKD